MSRNGIGDVGQIDDPHGGLAKLAVECEEIGAELLKHLHEVTISGRSRKRDALKRAFQRAFEEDQIETLKSNLDNCRDQFSFHLLASVRLVDLTPL